MSSGTLSNLAPRRQLSPSLSPNPSPRGRGEARGPGCDAIRGGVRAEDFLSGPEPEPATVGDSPIFRYTRSGRAAVFACDRKGF